MNKCPNCGADTRPGDNFCLNCGNRLFPAASSPQQEPMIGGDATIPGPDNWGTPLDMATIPAAGCGCRYGGHIHWCAPVIRAGNRGITP